jgi:hypothetical protein
VEDSSTAIRNRLIIINRTGKDVSLDAAAMMRGVMTRIIKIFRNMVTHSFLHHEYNSNILVTHQKKEAPGSDSRGFEGRTSGHPNGYRFKGKGTNNRATPAVTAEPDARIPCEAGCPLNTKRRSWNSLSN